MPESPTWLNVHATGHAPGRPQPVAQPRATSDWLWQESSYRLGRVATVALRDDWTVRCHPTSASAFRVIHDDPDQSCELASFVQRCTPGMIFYDIGAASEPSRWRRFTMAVRRAGPSPWDPSPLSNRVFRVNVDLGAAPATASR